jgi:hypothetical protein
MPEQDAMYPGAEDSMDSEQPESKDTLSKKDDEHQTALLPLKFFEGQELKPGEQYYVTVKRIFDGEVEVEYPKKEEVKGNEGDAPEADDALDGMAKEKPMGAY